MIGLAQAGFKIGPVEGAPIRRATLTAGRDIRLAREEAGKDQFRFGRMIERLYARHALGDPGSRELMNDLSCHFTWLGPTIRICSASRIPSTTLLR
jgi:hypothetical protein